MKILSIWDNENNDYFVFFIKDKGRVIDMKISRQDLIYKITILCTACKVSDCEIIYVPK